MHHPNAALLRAVNVVLHHGKRQIGDWPAKSVFQNFIGVLHVFAQVPQATCGLLKKISAYNLVTCDIIGVWSSAYLLD